MRIKLYDGIDVNRAVVFNDATTKNRTKQHFLMLFEGTMHIFEHICHGKIFANRTLEIYADCLF